MTAVLRWFDDRRVRDASAVLVPCVVAPTDPEDLNYDRRRPAPRGPWPGTLTPDGGATVVLRVPGDDWRSWLGSAPSVAAWFTEPRPLRTTDETTGGPWTIYLTSLGPPEFRALLREAYTDGAVTLLSPDEHRRRLDEIAPLFWRRYEHLDPRPMRERL